VDQIRRWSVRQNRFIVMKLHLKKFDMSKISDKSVVVFIGARGAGKSILCKDLLYHHQSLPAGMVISGTEDSNQFYSSIIPPCFIYNEYAPELVEKFVKRQKMITKKMRKEKDMFGNSKLDPRGFLIMDDCLYDKGWQNDVNIRSCFLNGRHFNTFFIFTSQYALAAPPILRNNIDYVFILREPRVTARKKIYENYAGFVPTFEIFSQIVTQCTENYECIVIDNTTKSNNISDQLYWYKAEIHGDFKLGAKEFWQIGAANDTESDDDDEEMFNAEALNRNKKGPKINVHKKTF
jgi:hypothetical protein